MIVPEDATVFPADADPAAVQAARDRGEPVVVFPRQGQQALDRPVGPGLRVETPDVGWRAPWACCAGPHTDIDGRGGGHSIGCENRPS